MDKKIANLTGLQKGEPGLLQHNHGYTKKHQENALIHVHVYYEDMWHELAQCVDNVSIPYELFVTLSRETPGLRQAIRGRYPKAHIHVVPNLGYDVAPFIEILNRVNLDNYAYVIKLHTKRNVRVPRYLNGIDVGGSKWRDALLGFIKTPHDFKGALSYLRRHRKVGAVARGQLILEKRASDNKRFAADIDRFLRNLGWQCSNYSFVAGTMFMMRAHLLKPLQNRWTTDDFEEPEPDSYQLAHRIERLLGCCVYGAGYIIHDWRLRPGEHVPRLLTAVGHFLYHAKTTRSGRTLVKICKIPVWWAKAQRMP